MRLNQIAKYRQRVTNLHNEHVISVHALSGEVTHVANQSRLSTSCLSHDDHWNTTSVCVCGVCVGGERKLVHAVRDTDRQTDRQT